MENTEDVIKQMRESMRKEVAREIRDLRKESQNEIDAFAKISTSELRRLAKESREHIENVTNALRDNPEHFMESAEIAAKEEIDKAGLRDSIKPKWIKKENQKSLSYKGKAKKIATDKVAAKKNEVTESIVNQPPVEKPKKGFFSELSDKLYKSMLKLLEKIEKNTRGTNNKNQTKPTIKPAAVVGSPARKRTKPKNVPQGVQSDNENWDIYDAVQNQMEPVPGLAMTIAKHQLMNRNKRKETKITAAKTSNANKTAVNAAALIQPRDPVTGKYRARTTEEKKEYLAAKAAAAPSSEPESKVKFDLQATKNERIQDDPAFNASMSAGAANGGGLDIPIIPGLPGKGGKTPPGKKPPAGKGGLLRGATNALKTGARFLGPAAAVGGAAYAGYEVGGMIKESSWGDKLGLSSKASDEGRSVGSKLFDMMNKDDDPTGAKAIAKQKALNLEKQQKKTDAAKKQSEQPPTTVVSAPQSTTNNTISGGTSAPSHKGIGTRNVESSFVRYLDSRTNFA
jgi:hypothetical protein